LQGDGTTILNSWEEAVLWLRSQTDKKDLVADCYYDDPLLEAARRYRRSSEWQVLSGLLPFRKGRALDVGAGRGISAYALVRDAWQVTALEPNPGDVVGSGAIRSLFKEAGLPVEIVEEWGEHLPFSDHSFDMVHMRSALHHAKDPVQLCREAARVLKPGGMFFAIREHVISKPSDLETFLADHPLHHLYGGENAFTLKQYLTAIKTDGQMEVLKVLNPMATDINLFPQSRKKLKKRIGSRLKLPWPAPIPDGFLTLVGHFYNRPGRLYSFIAKKLP